MSYWIIHSIPGKGLFFTVDTRTTADFQDGNGDVYCDGETKLFAFRGCNGKKSGAVCIAGTSFRYTKDYRACSIAKVFADITNSNEFDKFLSSNECTNAEDIFKFICKHIKLKASEALFINEKYQDCTLEDIIKTECAIGIGLINSQNIPESTTLYADGFIYDNKVVCVAHKNEHILIGSNEKYLKLSQDNSPIISQQIFNYHERLINEFKSNNPEMSKKISNNYDKVYCQTHGENISLFCGNKENILDKKNYNPLIIEHKVENTQ